MGGLISKGSLKILGFLSEITCRIVDSLILMRENFLISRNFVATSRMYLAHTPPPADKYVS